MNPSGPPDEQAEACWGQPLTSSNLASSAPAQLADDGPDRIAVGPYIVRRWQLGLQLPRSDCGRPPRTLPRRSMPAWRATNSAMTFAMISIAVLLAPSRTHSAARRIWDCLFGSVSTSKASARCRSSSRTRSSGYSPRAADTASFNSAGLIRETARASYRSDPAAGRGKPRCEGPCVPFITSVCLMAVQLVRRMRLELGKRELEVDVKAKPGR